MVRCWALYNGGTLGGNDTVLPQHRRGCFRLGVARSDAPHHSVRITTRQSGTVVATITKRHLGLRLFKLY